METIEDAKVEDVPAIKEMLTQTWQASYGSFLPQETLQVMLTSWHDPKNLAEEIENPDIFFQVIKKDNKVAALIEGHLQEGNILRLDKLYVLPAYQHQGLGTALLKAVQKHFPTAVKMQLDVMEENTAGIEYYKKHGFYKTDRQTEDFSGFLLSGIIMEKILGVV